MIASGLSFGSQSGSDTGSLPLVQVFFARPTPFNFAQVVSDMRALLDASSPDTLLALWEQDDLVTLDLGHLRVILCCGETEISGGAAHLTLGLTQTGAGAFNIVRLNAIAKVLVRRLEARHRPDKSVWAETNAPFTAEAMELVAHDMFRIAMARHFVGAEPLAGLRKPVSETDVMAFFGRMPQVATRLRGMSGDKAEVTAQRGAGTRVAAGRARTWVRSGAVSVAAMLVFVPLGLSLMAPNSANSPGLAQSIFKVIPVVSSRTPDAAPQGPPMAQRPDPAMGYLDGQ